MDDKSVPICVWHVHAANQLRWRAAPADEIFISPTEAPVIGVRYTGARFFAFTDAEKLLLPDPPVSNTVVTLALRRADLAAAPRVARSENDPDDLDYDPYETS